MPERPLQTPPAGLAGTEWLWPGAAAAVDEIVADYQRSAGQPGIAYGVVAGGSLVHSGGAGQRWLGGQAPDADTVFRIASMTKSFTASAILALRDDGALRLADPAEDFIPELRGMRRVTADSPPISIQHLLTMTAGFPTDDPWGDRQQSLPLAEFSALLTAGVRPAWAPGTCFEYSNLGYALLGRVIAAAAQTSYPAFVAARLLGPLGLGQTGFEAADFDSAQLARGYRRSPDGWAELAPDGYGAFAPMGGAFSSVRDLARWTGGFAAAFPPGDPDAGDPHPLPRAARREMQLPQVALRLRPQLGLPGNPGAGSQHSYGFGLFIEESSTWGRIVYHSGGYPGFGSHMRWHPATGLGVIVLANSTYAGAHPLAVRLMEALLRGGPIGAQPAAGNGQPLVRGPAPAPGGPWPETVDAQQVVTRLLGSWDDAVAHRLFADNVALDEPYPQRRAKIERIWQRIGPPRDEPPRPAEFDSPAHCRWWLPGERGDAQVEILLTPEDPPRVQSLTLSVPPAPDSPVWQHAQTVISLINDAPSRWPTELPASASLDTAVLIRQLRMAGAWAGRCRPGAFCGGNGQTSTVVEVDGEHARLTLAVELDPDQSLNRVEITLLS